MRMNRLSPNLPLEWDYIIVVSNPSINVIDYIITFLSVPRKTKLIGYLIKCLQLMNNFNSLLYISH